MPYSSSCCKGALTFDKARLVKDKLTCSRAVTVPNQKERDFRAVSATAYWGIENCKELFGLVSDKEALSAVFEAGTSLSENKKKLLFGTSSIVLHTLEHWREWLNDAFKLTGIESLRASAELCKARAETEKALSEKERAASECIHAKLKMEQMQTDLESRALGTQTLGNLEYLKNLEILKVPSRRARHRDWQARVA